MEHKGQLQPEKKGSQEGEAMDMASSPSFFLWHPFSLLHRVTRSCAGYLGLSRLCHALKDLKPRCATSPPPAATSSSQPHEEAQAGGAEQAAEDDCPAVEVRSRGLPQRPRELREGPGGRHH